MSSSHLASIWSSYAQSPHGVPTLRDYCTALISHPLSSSQLIPAPGGFTLQEQLIDALTSALPAVEALTRAAAGRRRLPMDELSCSSELRLIRTYRTLGRITLTWVLILQRLGSHMQELELMCAPSGAPRLHHLSTIPQIVDSLCPLLRAVLPRSIFDIFHIPNARYVRGSAPQTEVRLRQVSRAVEDVLDNDAARRATTREHRGGADVPERDSVEIHMEPIGAHRRRFNTSFSSSPPSSTSLPTSVTGSWWGEPKTHFKSSKAFFKSVKLEIGYIPTEIVPDPEPNILQGLAAGPVGTFSEAFRRRKSDAPASIRAMRTRNLPPASPSIVPSPRTNTARGAQRAEHAPRREVSSQQTIHFVEKVLDDRASGHVNARTKCCKSPASIDALASMLSLDVGVPRIEVRLRQMSQASEEVLDDGSATVNVVHYDSTSTGRSEVVILAASHSCFSEHETLCRLAYHGARCNAAPVLSIIFTFRSLCDFIFPSRLSFHLAFDKACRTVSRHTVVIRSKYHTSADVSVVRAPPKLDLAAIAQPAVRAQERMRRDKRLADAASGATILPLSAMRYDVPITRAPTPTQTAEPQDSPGSAVTTILSLFSKDLPSAQTLETSELDARAEARQAKENEEQLHRVAYVRTTIFRGSISTKNKPQLKDLAYALDISTDGTSKQLTTRINTFFEDNDAMRNDPWFMGIFTRSRAAAATDSSGPLPLADRSNTSSNAVAGPSNLTTLPGPSSGSALLYSFDDQAPNQFWCDPQVSYDHSLYPPTFPGEPFSETPSNYTPYYNDPYYDTHSPYNGDFPGFP
ncbi:hypothetical protein C8R47DRAFT_1269962 [Mycena vitilis]|nr:hypothetical protein C8R47DRAFT_1269962 [Mycena vitilis]